MNIAIDIDDTLTDSFDYFLPYVAEFFGVNKDDLIAKNISYSNLPPEWKSQEIEFCKTYYDHIVADTPFKSDAVWGVNQLRKLGHKIIIITGRTKDFYSDPYKTTKEELAKGSIIYDKLICTLDKANTCIQEKISVLIDDLPANCDAVAQKGIPAILFNSKENQYIQTKFQRVSNWDEAIKAISRLNNYTFKTK